MQSRPSLPWSRDEVRALAEVFPGRVETFIGNDASETEFKNSARDGDVLHLAMHTQIDDSSPLDSALVFTVSDADDRVDDGLLQTWEIFEHVQTHARLVVLSACSSALGRETSGEGLLGLKRAFHYAGARSILASLWDVSDRSTSELMMAFYASLQEDVNSDAALRQAQLTLLRREPQRNSWQQMIYALSARLGVVRDFSHPYHWAGFHVSGDTR